MRFIFLATVAALTASMPISAIPAVFSGDSQCIKSGQTCDLAFDFNDCCHGYYCYVPSADIVLGVCQSTTT
ncbi:uncharacterized protein EDB91DRAFT_1161226 [Suillus paluster]|uniref:uncharacterized protein n=1 Tax=Suillus paluster TaxID=48578 RepID=UPI001B861F6C|nr:uncharacterized protein EDB91DRAFT_1161226 [Suillus paluster]KAG1728602.1 hypothetical protein EDB91DRAFT_1161226 [Suillus paluster]